MYGREEGTISYIYGALFEWKHDAQMMIVCLYHSLFDVPELLQNEHRNFNISILIGMAPKAPSVWEAGCMRKVVTAGYRMRAFKMSFRFKRFVELWPPSFNALSSITWILESFGSF